MLKVRTTRDAKGSEALNIRPTTTGDITKRQVSARTVRNIRRGHTVRGMRDMNRIGWKPWEQDAAEMLRMAEKQSFNYANRYYDALERSRNLLGVTRRRGVELQATVEELETTNEELQSTTEELEASNEELQATNEELHSTNEELQATTEELESANAYRQALIDSMLDILMTTDAKGIITEVNRATERISGYSRDELIGQPFRQFFTDPERAQAGIEQVIAEGGVSDYELTVITKDGQETPVSYNATVLRTRRGRITGVLGSARDITESKRAEETLARQTEELARSNAELEQFAYVASHDLQEPLRKIQAFGDRLETKYGEVLTDEGSDYLQRMRNAAERMQTLINRLLAFSRVTSGAEPFGSVNLAEVAEGVLADLAVRIERTGGRVEVGDMPIIDADPMQMRQLLQNLIDNGLKFHKEEEAPVVKVYAELLDEVCQIIVEDNGIGFDEKHLDRIFTIFQRLHGRSEYEGTGVGLAICRKIAERHGGSITAKSEPGEGATFIVTLPVKQDVKRQA